MLIGKILKSSGDNCTSVCLDLDYDICGTNLVKRQTIMCFTLAALIIFLY